MMNLYDHKRIRYSFLYSFLFHVILIWLLSFFIITHSPVKPKYISVGFIREEYLPQPLKVAKLRKNSKILGIPESSVVLKDMQFKNIEEVSLPESTSFEPDILDKPLPGREKERKTFVINTATGDPGRGNFDLPRSQLDN